MEILLDGYSDLKSEEINARVALGVASDAFALEEAKKQIAYLEGHAAGLQAKYLHMKSLYDDLLLKFLRRDL